MRRIWVLKHTCAVSLSDNANISFLTPFVSRTSNNCCITLTYSSIARRQWLSFVFNYNQTKWFITSANSGGIVTWGRGGFYGVFILIPVGCSFLYAPSSVIRAIPGWLENIWTTVDCIKLIILCYRTRLSNNWKQLNGRFCGCVCTSNYNVM